MIETGGPPADGAGALEDAGAASPVAGRWRAEPYSFAQAAVLVRELGVGEVTAAVLARRGFGEPAAARRFLEASETHDPFEFDGMAEAVELISSHVDRGSLIAVHGDYDVDGVSSTALLTRSLERLGARVSPRLPNRMTDGYGLSAPTVERIAAGGASLLVTADCGITAVEEVGLAKRLGMDVVVTDHHRPAEELPRCPIVHPALGAYPCPDLCATGVVFKLAEALYRTAGRDPAELEDELDLVALATVADVVPLVGENRTLVRRGLRALAGTARPGLRALMKVAGVEPQTLGERALGFALSPRINAAGRLHDPAAGLELLLTEDPDRALAVARELDAVNTERQAVETRILFEAERLLSESGNRDDPVYVLAAHGWHAGVIGIVASRLVERYHRPCVLVALDGEGRGRGSGRSISAFDLHAGLAACETHLERFGGHRMAAGLEVREEELDRFRAAFVAHARFVLTPADLTRVERVDAIVPPDVLGLDLVEELEALRPFGMGNPAVNLLLPGARVADVRPMGEGRHARFTVASSGVSARGVAFGVGSTLAGAADPAGERRHDMVARLEANEWQGAVEPRLVLGSIHTLASAEPGAAANGGCRDCECRACGADWWNAVWRELDPPPPMPRERLAAQARTVVDRRGRGILGVLSDLLSTEDPVVVVCADVSLRRSLLARELHPERFGRPSPVVASARCRPLQAAGRHFEPGAFWMADYAAIEADPTLLLSFPHVFALDPPPFDRLAALLRESGRPGGGDSFCHLGWGPPEVELARRVLEHEYVLRPSLEAVYRAIAAEPGGFEGEPLEEALRGPGRHPRSPALVGRCLRVLTELDLVEIERPGAGAATVKCRTVPGRRATLESSRAFAEYGKRYEEGLRSLSEPAPAATGRRAA